MGFNVLACDQACTDCIKHYKKKHDLKPGDGFKIVCNGIPKEYITADLAESLNPEEVSTYLASYDPVTWAAEYLDWHCKDPDGEIWKRKTTDGTLGEVTPYKEEEYRELVKQGKSAFNRPQQAILLRCTAKRKVCRIGRQFGKTETLCISILHNIFNKKDFRVIVITPYQTQIEVIFNRLNKLIKSSPKVANSVKRYVKAPNYTIELYNGSTVRGFTAGTKSGGNADAVRGQKANMLVFDEADYLSSEDMASALAVITNYPDATVWMSSTPTGKRERFYESCHSHLYKEYYFPSMVNPLWNQELEDFYRNEYTDIQYTHEICLAKGTLITTSNGVKPIEDIVLGDKVYNHNHKLINVIKGAWKTGTKEIITAHTTDQWKNVSCTDDHSFTNRHSEKIKISELNELAVYRNKIYDISHKEIILARLVAYNLGDGSSCSTRLQSSFYSSIKNDMENLLEDVKRLWPENKSKVSFDIVHGGPDKLVHVDGERHAVNVSANITRELIEYGIIRGEKVKQEFRVPEFVRKVRQWEKHRLPAAIYTIGQTKPPTHKLFMDQISFNVKREFLAALFGAEGSTPRGSDGFMPATVALSMSKRIGIDGSIFFDDLVNLLKELEINSTWTSHIVDKNTVYTLYIYNDFENIKRFFEVVGYRYCEEKEDLAFYWNQYLSHYKYELDKKRDKYNLCRWMRQQNKSYKEIMNETGLSMSQVDKAIHLDREGIRLYKEFMRFEPWIKEHLHNGAIYLQIVEKYKHRTLYDTYNITVDSPDHSYLLANGIRTFNCAEFGEQEQGVYQSVYIDEAKADYRYEDRRQHDWIYSIGVDWNDQKVGTTIAVVGFNPVSAQFKLFNRYVVSREGWTQHAAIQQIIDLNRYWQPRAIYIDKGYGHAQYEIIKKYGYDSLSDQGKGPSHPDAKLHKITKQFDFGSKVTIKDLMTKQDVDKPAKPFLVENSVRRFEQRQIQFSKYDSQLESELRGYIIDHTTISGSPVYRQGNEKVGDHNLDALNLALIAFTLEMSEFGKVRFDNHIAFTPGFGQTPQTAMLPGRPMEVKKNQQQEQKPSMSRTKVLESQSLDLKQAPAANMNAGQRSLWAWPGFERDAPKPARSIPGGMSRRSSPPVRKKI